MQYSLPQFVEVEDKILPFLTIRQFLIVVGVAVVCLIFWMIFGLNAIFFVLSGLTALIVLPVAFVKFNGRPILSNLPGLIHYFTTPKRRIFIRGAHLAIHKQQAQTAAQSQEAEELPAESRLKKLAYLLDEKAAEEERLLRTGEYSKKWLNEV